MLQQSDIPQGFGQAGSLNLDKKLTVLDPTEPLTVVCNQSVQELIEMLQDYHIGCSLVVDEDGKLAGIVSKRDILTKWALWETAASEIPVSEIMTPDPLSLDADATIAAALYLMSKGGFRHIPIVDGEKRPTGVISVKDIMDYIALQFMKNLFSNV